MDLLKNRKTAVGVFVVVVIVFTLISAHRGLNRLCRAAETPFFDSESTVLQDYDCHFVPAEQLNETAKYANNLMSAINGNDVLADYYTAIAEARSALLDALKAEDISALYDAADDLRDTVEELDKAVQAGAELPDSYIDYDSTVSNLLSSISVVENCGYNDYLKDYTAEKLSGFPTGFLRLVSFVKAPEKFA